MSPSERLLHQVEDLEREIEEIEESRRMLDLCPTPDGLPGLSRAVRVYFLRRELERRMHFLRLQRNAAQTCYLHAEGRDRRVERRASSGFFPR